MLHFPHPSHIKMLHFLKKHWKQKPSKTQAPPEDAAHQITNIGTGYGRDSEGKRRSRQISTDKADETDPTMEPDTSYREGPRIVNQGGRIENQQRPAPNVSTLTPGHGGDDASERTWLQLSGPMFDVYFPSR